MWVYEVLFYTQSKGPRICKELGGVRIGPCILYTAKLRALRYARVNSGMWAA